MTGASCQIDRISLAPNPTLHAPPSRNLPTPRSYQCCVPFGNKLLLFGGQHTGMRPPLWFNDLHLFDPSATLS